MVKGLANILAESVTGSTGGYSPAAAVIGVRPQKITHGTLVRHFLDAVERTNVIKGIDAGRKTTVKTEDLVVNEGGQGKVVEEVGEELPDIGIAVFPQALIVEAVDLGNLARLVVASQNGDPLWVSNLEGHQQRHCLDRVVTTVNVITHEEVVGVGVRSTNLEQLHQVVELTVNITAHCNRAFLSRPRISKPEKWTIAKAWHESRIHTYHWLNI